MPQAKPPPKRALPVTQSPLNDDASARLELQMEAMRAKYEREMKEVRQQMEQQQKEREDEVERKLQAEVKESKQQQDAAVSLRQREEEQQAKWNASSVGVTGRKAAARWEREDVMALANVCLRVTLPGRHKNSQRQAECYIEMAKALNSTWKAKDDDLDKYSLEQVKNKFRAMSQRCKEVRDKVAAGERVGKVVPVEEEWYATMKLSLEQGGHFPPAATTDEDGLSEEVTAVLRQGVSTVTPVLSALSVRGDSVLSPLSLPMRSSLLSFVPVHTSPPAHDGAEAEPLSFVSDSIDLSCDSTEAAAEGRIERAADDDEHDDQPSSQRSSVSEQLAKG